MQSCKTLLNNSNMKIKSEMLEMADREQEHWQRVGLLVVFGGGTLFWLTILLLVELIW